MVYQPWQIIFYGEVLRYIANLQHVLDQPNGKLAVLEIFKAMLAADSEENGIIDLSVNTYLLICPVKTSVLDRVISILDLAIVQETVR